MPVNVLLISVVRESVALEKRAIVEERSPTVSDSGRCTFCFTKSVEDFLVMSFTFAAWHN